MEKFEGLVKQITGAIAGRAVDGGLGDYLNAEFGSGGDTFQALAESCRRGVAEGWLCKHERGGIKFGRVIKPGGATHGFSVDVVEMNDVAGPHHSHPKGEIDMIISETGGSKFDGHGEGWLVYGPGTAHKPTVTGGRALVLYLLPGGEIEFTKT